MVLGLGIHSVELHGRGGLAGGSAMTIHDGALVVFVLFIHPPIMDSSVIKLCTEVVYGTLFNELSSLKQTTT